MGYEYLYIDSKHRKSHEVKSEMVVNLSSPILHAKSVRCIALSAANEFFNVFEGANTITFIMYKISTPPDSKTYTIPPGLYTIVDLIAKINSLILADPVPSTSITLSLLAGGKVNIQATHATSQTKRMIIYHPLRGFTKSIIHRLGFSHNQVSKYANSDLITIASTVATYNLPLKSGGSILTEADFEANPIFTVWKPTTAVTSAQNKVGTHIGYEARCSHLFLKSNLIRDFHCTIYDDFSDLSLTTQQNIMQKIDINVNIYSWIHYRSSLTESFVHQLSGQPINHFTIQLCDDEHNVFDESNFKNFSCILMFETHDDLDSRKINERVIEANQQKIFLANHNC